MKKWAKWATGEKGRIGVVKVSGDTKIESARNGRIFLLCRKKNLG